MSRIRSLVIGHVSGFFLAVLALLEDHLEGDEEEQEAARDPESGQGDAEGRQDRRAGDREKAITPKAMSEARIDT